MVTTARRSWWLPFCMLLAGCTRDGLFGPAGDVAEKQAAHLVSILLWMLPVVVPLLFALPVIAWRHRIGGRGRYTPEWAFSWTLELLIWGLPAVVVGVLGWNLWRETVALDPYNPRGPAPLEIRAISYDWKWLFLYPSGIATADSLTLPEDRPVTFRLTSATVLQAFAIPRLGGQIYAMPGMSTVFNLRTGPAGTYSGLNMQYNGVGFSRQSFAVHVVPQAAFESWEAGVAASAPQLDTRALTTLAREGTLAAPRDFGRVIGDPFSDIMQAAMAGCAETPCGGGS